ncbi:MAG: Orotate phosphoribosyltransferase [Candidatus Moanabacter tarae]|uniref:Orotate phosphoribosyltransferase n=1 Tax=Candidatus Moanibacter tarae TaxID=2200854 RepID=A0A2Z4ACE6_9BACT|nr:MAG: Orotate phosphoribosyltransferase [Candidatus Moanabacter tarae]|tara:strand:+ start:116 stop:646 length:531 start_codon:yes stop_codon:yes gene_type:complete
MTKTDLARQVYDTCYIRGCFQLRSGSFSNDYFDKYLFESEPLLLKQIVESMSKYIPEETQILGGLEMGGIPIVTLLSQVTGIPSVFVRKEAKSYGTCKFAEGRSVKGMNTAIIEDVVTSGGQIILSAAALREEGAIIDTVLCVIDRESGGKEKLQKEGLRIIPLFTRSELDSMADL